VRRAATVEAAPAMDHGPRGGPGATDTQVCAGLHALGAAAPPLWRMPLLNARIKEPIWRLGACGFHKRCREEDGPPATAWRVRTAFGGAWWLRRWWWLLLLLPSYAGHHVWPASRWVAGRCVWWRRYWWTLRSAAAAAATCGASRQHGGVLPLGQAWRRG
jgi:hypothetical protein